MISSRLKKSRYYHMFFILLTLALVAIFYDFESFYKNCQMMVFQSRDLLRSQALLNGDMIFFGPEMTGGGHLFGPLYYFLLLPATFFSNAWKAGWWEMNIVNFSAGAAAAIFLHKKIGFISALLFLAFFVVGIPTHRYMTMYVNTSFLFPFALVSIISAALSFSADEKYRIKYFYICCITVGLGIQIHFSIFPILLATSIMQIFAKQLNLPRLPWITYIIGIALFILPSIPYFIWRAIAEMGVIIGQYTPMIGEPTEVIDSFIYVAKSGLSAFNGRRAISLAKLLYHSAPTALLPLLITAFIYRKETEEIHPNFKGLLLPLGKQLIKPLTIVALLILPQLIYAIVARFAGRYGLIWNVSMMILMPILILHLINTKKKQLLFLFLSFLILVWQHITLFQIDNEISNTYTTLNWLVLITLLFTLYIVHRKYGPRNLLVTFCLLLPLFLSFIEFDRYQRRINFGINKTLLRQERWATTLGTIYQATGWNYKQIKRRVYFVNIHDNAEIKRTYLDVVNEIVPNPIFPLPDGFIVAVRERNELNTTFLDWLKTQNIQTELIEAINLGHLTIEAPKNRHLEVLPYYVNNTSLIPKHFHNWPLSYSKSEHWKLLSSISEPYGSLNTKNKNILFKWNECPKQNSYCDTGAIVKLHKGTQKGKLNVQLDIFGESISQSSIWIHPSWTASLNKPYLKALCDGKWSKKKVLISSIGYKDKYLHYTFDGFFPNNNSLIAPWEYHFTIPCIGQVETIEFGWSSTTVRSVNSSKEIPGKSILHIF